MIPAPIARHTKSGHYIFEVFSLSEAEWGLTSLQKLASNLIFYRHPTGTVTTFKSRFRQTEEEKPAEEFETEFEEVKTYQETRIAPSR